MQYRRVAALVAAALAVSFPVLASQAVDERPAADALTKARLALKQKDNTAAVSLFRAVYTAFPTSRQAPAAMLSHAYLIQGTEKAAAKLLLETVYQKFPDSPEAPKALLSHAHIMLGENATLAEEEFRTVGTRYPKTEEAARAWLRVAYIHLNARQPDAAIYLRMVADYYPNTVAAQQALFRLGRLSIRDKDYASAEDTLKKAEAAPGEDFTKSQALVHLGEVQMFRFLESKDKADLKKAEDILLHIDDKYQAESRSIMQGRMDIARVYAFMGIPAGVRNPALARQILLDGLAKWPETYFTMECHSIIGFTYQYENNDKAAIGYFEKVVKDHPKSSWNPMFLNAIGALYRRIGDYDRARDAYKECIAQGPNVDWALCAQQSLATLDSVGK